MSNSEEAAEVDVLTSRAENSSQINKQLKACIQRVLEGGVVLDAALEPISTTTRPQQILLKSKSARHNHTNLY